ncbi:MAG: tail fiber protein [Bryobacteraceae bacterium]|jgi:microcystin-dependent protein
MSNLYLGQLLLVPYNFAPQGWIFANGQILPISQNTALFALIGTFYGGDGKSTFALPDLRGRIPIGSGQGAGLQNYALGEPGGTETVTLLTGAMPMHNHNLTAFAAGNNVGSPVGHVFSHIGISDGGDAYGISTATLNDTLTSTIVWPIGNNLPHDNMMPYLTLNWVIARQGVFPTRS